MRYDERACMRLFAGRTAAITAALTFWLALVVLVANDHWLKHSAIAPSWLTGKLSDFAGLIVAPIVLCGVARVTGPRARLFCLALVALPFAGFELWPAWGHALEFLAAYGLRLRTWPDLSDLFALAILPVTYWVLKQRTLQRRVRLGPAFFHRLGVICGSAACLATMYDPDDQPPRPPLIENRSHLPLTLTLRRYLGAVDCESMTLASDAPAATDFGTPLDATLEPAEQLSAELDGDDNAAPPRTRSAIPEGVSAGAVPVEDECGAIWLASPQLPDLIFGFRVHTSATRRQEQDTLVIAGPNAELRSYPGANLWIAEAEAPSGDPEP
jgi:hypothetical protein